MSGMNQPKPVDTSWKAVFLGKIFEIAQNDKGWEKATRAPGVRLILDDETTGGILLTREFRSELNSYDYRLPGGKVFDSLDEFEEFRSQGVDILEPATAKVVQEAREETGYDILDPQFITKSILGSTVEWDLYVFAATKFTKRDSGQELGTGEDIQTDLWFSYAEVRKMIMNGEMQEERIALALIRYLESREDKLGTN